MIHINGLEDAEELGHELHRTSYDMKKAFDSVSKSLMLLAWQRLGVPYDVAQWLVSMDINGVTVVKTPYSLHIWEQLMYYSIRTPIDKPDGYTTATEDSTLIDAFDAIRGTGQGDVTSPTCWVAVMDILLTALRRADNARIDKIYYRSDGPEVYRSEETSYADDLESISNDPKHLQEKADIVSAYCILAGLQLSHGKLRRVVQNTMPDAVHIDMIVHTYPWTPRRVTLNTIAATEYLGGIYDVHSTGVSALNHILDTAQVHCNAIRYSPVPATAKVIVATASVVAVRTAA